MKNILILDDDMRRIGMFNDRLCRFFREVNITHVAHVSDCIRELSSGRRFDLVYLDHDLDGRTYVHASDPNCGTRVAEFLRDNPDIRDRHFQIVVHSYNEHAAPKMAEIITGATWNPGAWNQTPSTCPACQTLLHNGKCPSPFCEADRSESKGGDAK